jgi:hypothetical protein
MTLEFTLDVKKKDKTLKVDFELYITRRFP